MSMEKDDYILSVSDLMVYAVIDILDSDKIESIISENENQDIDLRFAKDILYIYHFCITCIGIEHKVVKLYYYGFEDNRVYALLFDNTQIEIGYTLETVDKMTKEAKAYLQDAIKLYSRVSQVHVNELLLEESHRFYGYKDDSNVRFVEPNENDNSSDDQWKLLEVLFKAKNKEGAPPGVHTKNHIRLSSKGKISEDLFNLVLAYVYLNDIQKENISFISCDFDKDGGYKLYLVDKKQGKIPVDVTVLEEDNDKERIYEIEELLSKETKNKDFIRKSLEEESQKFFEGKKTKFEIDKKDEKESCDKAFERMKENLNSYFDSIEDE